MTGPAQAAKAGRWSLNAIGGRAARWIERHEAALLIGAIALFALAGIYRDLTTPIWFDEFFTLFLSRMSSASAIWRAMPSDGQPPLQYLLTHLSLQLFGENELALRLPELAACLVSGWLVYAIVRRRGSAVQALFASVLLMGAQQWQQALSARPYGLLLAFTGLVFLAWQRAAWNQRRFWPLCWMALGMAGAILSHHFGAIYLGMLLAAGETARTIERRKIDLWMLVAIAAGLSPLAITLPLARQSSAVLGDAVHHSAVFWAKPRLVEIFRYSRAVAWPLLALSGVLAGLIAIRRPASVSSEPAESPIPRHEWSAAAALALLLPLQLLLAQFATGYFQTRYAVGTMLGMAILCAWGLPRLNFLRPVATPALALATLIFLAATAGILVVNQARRSALHPDLAGQTLPPSLLNAPGDRPIVVASAYDYAPLWWYAPPELRSRLIYLSDLPYAIRQQDFLPELSLATAQASIPLRIADYRPFLENHPHFLLYLTGQRRLEWVGPRLASEGYQMKLAAITGQRALFQVDRATASR